MVRGYRTLTRTGRGPVAAAPDPTLSLLALVLLSHFLGWTIPDLKRSFLSPAGRSPSSAGPLHLPLTGLAPAAGHAAAPTAGFAFPAVLVADGVAVAVGIHRLAQPARGFRFRDLDIVLHTH